MPLFEHFADDARQIEARMHRLGLVLGIDWRDPAQVRGIARQALAQRGLPTPPQGRLELCRTELFALAHLMLDLMRQSAEENVRTQGGAVWRSFARALEAEVGDGVEG